MVRRSKTPTPPYRGRREQQQQQQEEDEEEEYYYQQHHDHDRPKSITPRRKHSMSSSSSQRTKLENNKEEDPYPLFHESSSNTTKNTQQQKTKKKQQQRQTRSYFTASPPTAGAATARGLHSYYRPPLLIALIENQEWDQAIQRIHEHPEEVQQEIMEHEIDEEEDTRDEGGDAHQRTTTTTTTTTALHVACQYQPPVELITALLQVNERAIQQPDPRGALPLHVACASGASVQVVTRLLMTYPSATRCKDHVRGQLPLHWAIQSYKNSTSSSTTTTTNTTNNNNNSSRTGTSEDVVLSLIVVYPKASLIRNRQGYTPVELAGESAPRALQQAPLLLAVSKAALTKVEYDSEAKLRQAVEEYQDRMASVKAKYDEDKTHALALEVQLRQELGESKERAQQLEKHVVRLERELQAKQDELLHQENLLEHIQGLITNHSQRDERKTEEPPSKKGLIRDNALLRISPAPKSLSTPTRGGGGGAMPEKSPHSSSSKPKADLRPVTTISTALPPSIEVKLPTPTAPRSNRSSTPRQKNSWSTAGVEESPRQQDYRDDREEQQPEDDGNDYDAERRELDNLLLDEEERTLVEDSWMPSLFHREAALELAAASSSASTATRQSAEDNDEERDPPPVPSIRQASPSNFMKQRATARRRSRSRTPAKKKGPSPRSAAVATVKEWFSSSSSEDDLLVKEEQQQQQQHDKPTSRNNITKTSYTSQSPQKEQVIYSQSLLDRSQRGGTAGSGRVAVRRPTTTTALASRAAAQHKLRRAKSSEFLRHQNNKQTSNTNTVSNDPSISVRTPSTTTNTTMSSRIGHGTTVAARVVNKNSPLSTKVLSKSGLFHHIAADEEPTTPKVFGHHYSFEDDDYDQDEDPTIESRMEWE